MIFDNMIEEKAVFFLYFMHLLVAFLSVINTSTNTFHSCVNWRIVKYAFFIFYFCLRSNDGLRASCYLYFFLVSLSNRKVTAFIIIIIANITFRTTAFVLWTNSLTRSFLLENRKKKNRQDRLLIESRFFSLHRPSLCLWCFFLCSFFWLGSYVSRAIRMDRWRRPHTRDRTRRGKET
jgi:hypothetical protein